MSTTTPSRGAQMIDTERRRQLAEEGYTPEHDRGHGSQLAAAASAYRYHGNSPSVPLDWPWAARFWKPGTPLRNLVRAGALYRAAADAFAAEGHPAVNLRTAANHMALAIDDRLDRLDVIDIGEDGGVWFVSGAQHEDEARVLIEAHIADTSSDADWFDKQTATLSRATFEPRRLWFATGHGEGDVIMDEEPPKWETGLWVVSR